MLTARMIMKGIVLSYWKVIATHKHVEHKSVCNKTCISHLAGQNFTSGRCELQQNTPTSLQRFLTRLYIMIRNWTHTHAIPPIFLVSTIIQKVKRFKMLFMSLSRHSYTTFLPITSLICHLVNIISTNGRRRNYPVYNYL